MGKRGRASMDYEKDSRKRRRKFKRKKGTIFQKQRELSTLCNSSVLVVIKLPGNKKVHICRTGIFNQFGKPSSIVILNHLSERILESQGLPTEKLQPSSSSISSNEQPPSTMNFPISEYSNSQYNGWSKNMPPQGNVPNVGPTNGNRVGGRSGSIRSLLNEETKSPLVNPFEMRKRSIRPRMEINIQNLVNKDNVTPLKPRRSVVEGEPNVILRPILPPARHRPQQGSNSASSTSSESSKPRLPGIKEIFQ